MASTSIRDGNPDVLMRPAGHLTGHRGEVRTLHCPVGDERLASGSEDGTVRVWDLNAGRTARALILTSEPDCAVNAVCMGATPGAASNLVFAAAGVHVFGFDLRAPGLVLHDPERRLVDVARDEIGHLLLDEASGVLAAADDAGEVHLLDTRAGRPTLTLSGVHTSICSWVAFRPGVGSELCSVGLDALCVRWDWRLAACVDAWQLAQRHAGWAAASASGSGFGEAVTSSTPCGQVLNPRHAHCVSFAPDGEVLAVALGDGSVEVRLAESGQPVAAVDAHRAAASQAHFCPHLLPALCAGAAEVTPFVSVLPLVTAGDDRSVRLWAVEGVVGRGRAQGGGKRRRHRADEVPMEVESTVTEEAIGASDDCRDEPGFRSLAMASLSQKPNSVAVAAAADARRSLVCVATTGDAIELLQV